MTARALLDKEALHEAVREWAIESGGRVRARRHELKLTQVQLAQMADTTPETVCRIELGQIVPREPMKLALAYALMQEVNELWQPLSRQRVHDGAADAAFAIEARGEVA